jgi:CHRD domain
MNKIRWLLVAVVVLILLAAVGTVAAGFGNWRAHLQSDNEVVTVPIVSDAQGQATFQLNEDGTAVDYKLNVANIDNVIMAHIHVGPPGVNGPIVVWLYPAAPPPQLIPGRTDGLLAEGTFTSANFVGPLAGHPLDDLLALLESGGAYVNVHTSLYPSGEMRGQTH